MFEKSALKGYTGYMRRLALALAANTLFTWICPSGMAMAMELVPSSASAPMCEESSVPERSAVIVYSPCEENDTPDHSHCLALQTHEQRTLPSSPLLQEVCPTVATRTSMHDNDVYSPSPGGPSQSLLYITTVILRE